MLDQMKDAKFQIFSQPDGTTENGKNWGYKDGRSIDVKLSRDARLEDIKSRSSIG